MNIDKSRTACFSGYRPSKFLFSLDDKTSAEYVNLQKSIHAAIINAAEMGYNTFLCGMAKGFDLLCAKAVMEIKEIKKEQNEINLISVLPFETHSFSGEWGALHKTVKNASAEIIIASGSKNFTPECYSLRNTFMIENSSHLICYWDGQSGGTAQTIRMAKKHGHSIYNLLQG